MIPLKRIYTQADLGLIECRDMIGTDDQPGDKVQWSGFAARPLQLMMHLLQVEYVRMKFDWGDAQSASERMMILERLEVHALELSYCCGYPEDVLCFPQNMKIPNANIAT